jgi:hypothetical protein
VCSTRSVLRCYRPDRSRISLVELESLKRQNVGVKWSPAWELMSAVQGSEGLVGELVS